ncbi:carboxypeptidase-like regulatory domain-containing protein [Gabonibacter chumensis]|uniref:carboxypeptidase-like regulatory domain-containing protein n=1 Tax=Gabonibacter chumensis TaxID=2972474 RepID=UPI0025744DCE|nr:carboxypeptidase-like regulatory domain-containing protein [Gabonibacter chumensis]MCR9012759.1 carboxypeptidase-like regulatory domain-containing protein [Gabonibacter chumensis]
MKQKILFKGLSLAVMFFMGFTSVVIAQNRQVKVKGEVCDPEMNVILGVQIVEKGTTNSTITDLSGYFELTVSEEGTLLIICNGYVTREIKVKDFLAAQGHYLIITLVEEELLEEPLIHFYNRLVCCLETKR